MRSACVPVVWRLLPGSPELNMSPDDVPSCPDCGALFVEEAREGIFVRFVAGCVDRHDPAPPPKKMRLESKSEYCFSVEDMRRARQVVMKLAAGELIDVLAPRLSIHPYHLNEITSGRSEADAPLRDRIVAALEAVNSGAAPAHDWGENDTGE